MPEQQNDVQKIIIEDRKRLLLNGVVSVDGFSEQLLKLTLVDGKVFVYGEGIKITAFNKLTGVLQAEGSFFKLTFENEKKPLLKKIFR